MKLIINSKEDTFETHKDNPLVIGYLLYDLRGNCIGFHGKDSKAFPKCNYEFVVRINDKSISISNCNNLYQLDDGSYIVGYIVK